MFFNKPLDFLAVGDLAVDAFIRIKDAHVNCSIDNVGCEICLKFGDKVPFESVTEINAVGNSANAAVSAARLGLKSALFAGIGDDQRGLDCLDALEDNNVDVSYIKKYSGMKTNYHFVLWYGAERTILVKQENYPYKILNIAKPPKWIYLSSLGSNSLDFHAEIAKYLKAHPETKLAFQPGTFQMKLGKDKLAELYNLSEVFVCNVEESERILGLPENGLPKEEPARANHIKSLLKQISNLGPKITLITNGPEGAYMHIPETSSNPAYKAFTGYYYMPIYPDPKEPVERTGCGDSFASTYVASLITGKNPLEALEWAPVNPMSVVQYVGAQEGLLKREQLEKLLSEKPSHYRPVNI